MNIVVLTGSYAPETGGIAELIQGFATGLAANGCRVHVLSAIPGSHRYGSPGIPVTEFELPARGYLRRVMSCRDAVKKLVRSVDAERVVASSWSPFAVHTPARVNDRALHTDVWCHGMDLLEPMRSVRYRALLRRTLGRASVVIANSTFTAEIARTAGAEQAKTVIIHPGVDGDRFRPGPKDPALLARLNLEAEARIILSVGRLVERKGLDLVIRAMPAIVHAHVSARYVIVGDGPDRLRLERLAKSEGMAPFVRFAGAASSEELPAFYRSADLFALPNRFLADRGDVEGFGIVFLEAACTEIPSLGGRSGGTGDAIEDGNTGYLVDPENPADLAAHVCALLANETLRRRMGVAGRARALQQFQWKDLCARYLAWIRAA